MPILLIIITSIEIVKANEYPEITNDIEIRYKWYKETKEGDYYSIKENLPGYITDYNNYKYGDYSIWSKENCNLPDEFYLKEYKTFRIYDRIAKIKSIELNNFTYNNNIKIYFKDKIIGYKVIFNENNVVRINLNSEYMCDNLIFYIEDAQNYTINLYVNNNFGIPILSKKITNEKFLIPNKTWITKDTQYTQYDGNVYYETTDLTRLIKEYQVCRYREKYYYRYQIKKEYYDDNYHVNVAGYIKDTSDYKLFYTKEPITNTIEITKEKIIKQPQIEYIYITNEKEMQKNDSSNENNEISKKNETIDKKCLPKVETQIIEKEIFKTPKKLYIIIAVLLVIIVILIKKYIKNMSAKTNNKYCRNHIKK